MSAPIKIVHYSEVIDNWDRVDTSDDPEVIRQVLQQTKFTDDMTFRDENGRSYFIDDLIDKEVQVGDVVFTVVEE